MAVSATSIGLIVVVMIVGLLFGNSPISPHGKGFLDQFMIVTMRRHGGLTERMIEKDFKYIHGAEDLPLLFHGALQEAIFDFLPEDDHRTKVCKTSMYAKRGEEFASPVMMTSISDPMITLPPAERAEAYVETCLKVYAGLPEGGKQRRLLDALDPVPSPWQFIINVTQPWLNGRFTDPTWSGYADAFRGGSMPGHMSPPGSDAAWMIEREAAVDAMPSIVNRLKSPEELQAYPAHIRSGLEKLNLRPVRDEWVPVQNIPEALRHGRTVLFNATDLCGSEVFGLTMPDIAKLHSDMASAIPVFKTYSGAIGDHAHDTLEEVGRRHAWWNDIGWQNYPELGPFPEDELVAAAARKATPPRDWMTVLFELVFIFLRPLHGHNLDVFTSAAASGLRDFRESNTKTTINIKRLPRLPLQNMHKAMGSPSWVDTYMNWLWIGPVGEYWHYDEEDNLLICISGEIYVAVLEQHVTSIISNSRHVFAGWNDLGGIFQLNSSWLEKNPWMRQVPMHFMKLEPGMGITVPSKTYHNIMAPDGNRILLNCFFNPKFGVLEEAPASEHSWYKPGTQDDTFRAMRHLKGSSVAQLWDERKVGGFFTTKLEML